MSTNGKYKYGLNKQIHDPRDFVFRLETPITLPKSIDLRPNMPSVLNQGELGSCTANAMSNNLMYLASIRKPNATNLFQPSRLYIYYNTRVKIAKGEPHDDSGASMRDVCKATAVYSAGPETEWPYDISKYATEPYGNVYKNAMKNGGIRYQSVRQTLNSIKSTLARKQCVLMGIMVYESFENESTARTGVVKMPDTTKEVCFGGHAVLCCGYDDARSVFICQNSWGPEWGDKGYFYLPYQYAINPSLSCDFWTVSLLAPSP